jgi:hypothetical protein
MALGSDVLKGAMKKVGTVRNVYQQKHNNTYSSTMNTVTCLSVTRDRIWIGNRIYRTPTLVTTNNYESLTKLHTPAHIKSFHSLLAVAW